jgi:uncharacterized protein (TIGR02266 family)
LAAAKGSTRVDVFEVMRPTPQLTLKARQRQPFLPVVTHWLNNPSGQEVMETARRLISGVIPAASFPERERLILLTLRELARRTLVSELEAVDAVLPDAFDVQGTIVYRDGFSPRTVQSPFGELVVRASEYRPDRGTQPAYVPLPDATGCSGGITPALFELLVNGIPAVDSPPPSGALPNVPPATSAARVEDTARHEPAPADSDIRLRAAEPEPVIPPEGRPGPDSAPPPAEVGAAGTIPAMPKAARARASGKAPNRVDQVVDETHPWWDEPSFIQAKSNEREHFRVRVELAVQIGSEHAFYQGLTSDISEGGVFVATHAIRPIGSEIDFAVRLPGLREPIRGLARVRWVRDYSEYSDTSPGMGLQFVTVSDDDLEHIRDYVRLHEALLWED